MIMVLLIAIFNGCFFKHRQLLNSSILYANREGVASCMTHLYFQKNGIVIMKSFCFGSTTTKGTYIQRKDTFLIKGLNNDTTIIDLAILEKEYDQIGQISKHLIYYKKCDTLNNPVVFNAFDNETKCPDKKEIIEIDDLGSINERFSKKEMLIFEKNSNLNDLGSKSFLSECYYPNVNSIKLDSAISFYRNYTEGIPLKTYYYYSKDTLMVKYYEWSSTGYRCLYYLDKDDYINVYQKIITKLTNQYGNPKKVIGNLSNRKITQFERIWDSETQHMELHLYLYDGYRIRLIHYWK